MSSNQSPESVHICVRAITNIARQMIVNTSGPARMLKPIISQGSEDSTPESLTILGLIQVLDSRWISRAQVRVPSLRYRQMYAW